MKTHLFHSLVLTAIFAAGAFASVPFRPFVLDFAPGSAPEAVKMKLGAPSAMLGQDLWIYFGFSTPNPNVANPAFDTLVIAFTNGRVTAVKITDGRVVRRLLAQQEGLAKSASVATK